MKDRYKATIPGDPFIGIGSIEVTGSSIDSIKRKLRKSGTIRSIPIFDTTINDLDKRCAWYKPKHHFRANKEG
jgi:hypothetical protein